MSRCDKCTSCAGKTIDRLTAELADAQLAIRLDRSRITLHEWYNWPEHDKKRANAAIAAAEAAKGEK
jgi:hypothetical protein